MIRLELDDPLARQSLGGIDVLFDALAYEAQSARDARARRNQAFQRLVTLFDDALDRRLLGEVDAGLIRLGDQVGGAVGRRRRGRLRG